MSEHDRGWPEEEWLHVESAPRDGTKIRMRETTYPFREKIAAWHHQEPPGRGLWVSQEGGIMLPFHPDQWQPDG